ncbi:MAG: hypothetical protein JXB42_02755, partial [Deltaproteobacteria bacterium]|nr:hypothetical protein [Deltaproteobacteria bacterium]
MIGHMNILYNIRRFKISIGKNPQSVSSNTVVLFPLYEATFSCGIAGLLTIKGASDSDGLTVIENISRCFETIKTNTLTENPGREAFGDDYMGGTRILRDMDKYILKIKQDSSLQYSIFESAESEELTALSRAMNKLIKNEEELIDRMASSFSTVEMEKTGNSLTLLKDAAWALEGDVLSNIENTVYLSGQKDKKSISLDGFRKYRNINLLINSLDRLEVRGRDSAGVQIAFTLKNSEGLTKAREEIVDRGLYDQWEMRMIPGDLIDGSIHMSDKTQTKKGLSTISFTYKKASVTGKLGENGGYLRERIRADQILHIVINETAESDMYLAHTRWASVGSITEENCHPINNFTPVGNIASLPCKEYPRYGSGNWSISVTLNGDIDNYGLLRTRLEGDGEDIIGRGVTTDTKIISLQIEKYLYRGYDLTEAFRLALNDLEGSHAIAMYSTIEPEKVFLALRGSGQSLYIGLCDNQYIFSSELYGLVEATPYFIKMDGERERIEG